MSFRPMPAFSFLFFAASSAAANGLAKEVLHMTANEFRRLALSLPEATESAHMNHPDFRVRGKIFATIWPDNDWGMVKLTPGQQAVLIRSEPDVFQPIKGGWGVGAPRVCVC